MSNTNITKITEALIDLYQSLKIRKESQEVSVLQTQSGYGVRVQSHNSTALWVNSVKKADSISLFNIKKKKI